MSDLQTTLNDHARRIRTLVNQARLNIIQIGCELIEAKQRCAHGDWLPWLEREFGWTERTAQRYMQAAEVFGKTTALSDLQGITITGEALYLLSAPHVPPEVRAEAITKATAGEKIDRKKAIQIIERSPKATHRTSRSHKRRSTPTIPTDNLGGLSIPEFLRDLRLKIRDVRRKNKCERERAIWNVEASIKADLIALLDFIENELDRIPTIPAKRGQIITAPVKPTTEYEDGSLLDAVSKRYRRLDDEIRRALEKLSPAEKSELLEILAQLIDDERRGKKVCIAPELQKQGISPKEALVTLRGGQ